MGKFESSKMDDACLLGGNFDIGKCFLVFKVSRTAKES